VLAPGAYDVPWVNLVGEDGSVIREVDIRLVVAKGGEVAYLGTLTFDTHRASGAFSWLGFDGQRATPVVARPETVVAAAPPDGQ
jgi:hypothetical protein